MKNPFSSSKTKHIDARYLKEMATSGDISMQGLQSEDQHAIILTEGTGRERLSKGTAIYFRAGVRFSTFL